MNECMCVCVNVCVCACACECDLAVRLCAWSHWGLRNTCSALQAFHLGKASDWSFLTAVMCVRVVSAIFGGPLRYSLYFSRRGLFTIMLAKQA